MALDQFSVEDKNLLDTPEFSFCNLMIDEIDLELWGRFWDGSLKRFTGNGVLTLPIENTAFVSPSGNDATGVFGRFDLPFQTVQAAYAAAVAGTPSLIYVYPGTYGGASIVLKDQVNIYYSPGCTLSSGGWNVTADNTTVSITGKLLMTGTSKLSITGNSCNVVCDILSMETISSEAVVMAAPITESNLYMDVDSINASVASAFGRIFAMKGFSSLYLNSKNDIITNRRFMWVRSGSGAGSHIGNIIINAPKIVQYQAVNTGFNYDNALIEIEPGSIPVMTINADIEYTGPVSPNRDILIIWKGLQLTINGNINAGNIPGIYVGENFVGDRKVIINGDVISESYCIQQSSNSYFLVKDGLIKSNGATIPAQPYAYAVLLGTGEIDLNGSFSKIYFKGCRLLMSNPLGLGVILTDNGSPGTTFFGGQAYLYNCECYNENIATGLLADDGQAAPGTRLNAITLTVAGDGSMTDGTYYGISPDNIVGVGVGATFDVVVAGGIITEIYQRNRGKDYVAADTFNFATAIVAGVHTEVITVDTVATSFIGSVNTSSNVANKAEVGELFGTSVNVDELLEIPEN